MATGETRQVRCVTQGCSKPWELGRKEAKWADLRVVWKWSRKGLKMGRVKEMLGAGNERVKNGQG